MTYLDQQLLKEGIKPVLGKMCCPLDFCYVQKGTFCSSTNISTFLHQQSPAALRYLHSENAASHPFFLDYYINSETFFKASDFTSRSNKVLLQTVIHWHVGGRIFNVSIRTMFYIEGQVF